jgi:acyl-CoA thioesterase FadM
MAEWTETYRGIVKAWECDVFDHLTIAYYFEHYEDAAAVALERLPGAPRTTTTTGLYVRHLREFRAGDTLHIMSAPIAVGDGTLTIGHKVFDSANGDLAATVEQSVTLQGSDRGQASVATVAWDGPQRETRPVPAGEAGFVPSGRSIVKGWEIGGDGRLGWQHLIHRFSGAGLHACNAFGMTAQYLKENRRGYSTFELDLEVKSLPRGGDHLVLRSGILQIGKSSIRLHHRMTDARTGALVASLGQFGVHFDMDQRRPAPLPEGLREAALRLVGSVTSGQ